MVNFNNEKVLSIPLSEIKERLIIEKRENVLVAFKNLYRDGDFNDRDQILDLRANIISLYQEMRKLLIEHFKTEEQTIKRKAYSYKMTELTEAYDLLDDKVYKVIEINQEVIL